MESNNPPSPRWGQSGTASISEMEHVSETGHDDKYENRYSASGGRSRDGNALSPSGGHTGHSSIDKQDFRYLSRRDSHPYGEKEAGDIMLRERTGRRGPDGQPISGVDSMASSQAGFDSVFEREHVDVRAAQQAFERLSRQLSRASALARKEGDPESQDDSQDFDLLTYLQHVDSEGSKAGIKRKNVHVVWKDVSVQGVASTNLHLRTFMDTLIMQFGYPFIKIFQLFGAGKPPTRNLIQGFDGSLRAGEMCLVLGRPGSGCSTFLKTIANQRTGFLGVGGDITYSAIDAATFRKRYRGEAIYVEEEENHHPTLTVSRTLDFALSLKTPGRLLPGVTPAKFRAQTLNVLLKMFNITHTRNTLVGNAFVPGVSGGERKRVSIAEALASRMSVGSWDNSTRGLDASTALDYARSLRILTDILQPATFISLYQAGEGIWDLFDKVLVIDRGKCVYFGPRDQARQYFIDLGFADLPRQTSADYCCGCTDPNERRFAPGRDASTVPSTPEQLEAAYRRSEIFHSMMADRDALEEQIRRDRTIEEDFRAAVLQDKRKGAAKRSPYSEPLLEQVWYLTKRQLWIVLGNPFDLFMSYFTAIVVAIITGFIFLKLDTTSAGLFSRGGVVFMGLLFCAITAFVELPTQMGNRPILYKQQSWALYRPAAMPCAQLLAEIPVTFPRTLIFSAVLYLFTLYNGHHKSGMSSTDIAGNFFFFFICTYMTYLAMSALFRIFGTVCKDFNVAAKLGAIIIGIGVLFAGYMKPKDAMAGWIKWLPYLNPFYFAFSAMMINEFKSLDFVCVGPNVSPRNPPGMDIYPPWGPNQVCSVQGAQPGSQFVSGVQYLESAFKLDTGDMGRDFGIVCLFFVGLAVFTSVVIEVFEHGQFTSAMIITKKTNKEEALLDDKLKQRLEKRRSAQASNGGREEEADLDVRMKAQPLTWKSLTYTVHARGKDLQLLDHVDGFCEPGQLTALMGASGAGKTTLLDVLADRKSVGVIGGERKCSGKPIDLAFQRGCGYAEQLDIHEGTATVREALRFSAYLRQPAEVSLEEKNEYVEQVIELLEMQHIANAMIGTPEFGLSLSNRKLVTIGVELAARPELLLFLDEPTTGLDGQSAYNLVRHLRRLARAGQAIICTIHQPNSLLFEQFDRLLLLQKGGQVVYFGPIGNNSVHVVEYFKQNGAPMDERANPAEAMLDIIGAGTRPRVGPRDWHEIYLSSSLHQDNLRRIEEIDAKALQVGGGKSLGTAFATGFGFQMRQVLMRSLRTAWRIPDYQFTRLFQHAVMGILGGILFTQLGTNVDSIQERIFDLFQLTVIPAIILSSIEPMYHAARQVFQREYTSKMYSSEVFALSQLISEIPYSIANALVFFLINYYMVFVNTSAVDYSSQRAGYFFAMALMGEVFSTTLGQMIAAASPNPYIASLFTPFIAVVFALTCGVTIPKPNMAKFFRDFLYWVNPMSWLLGGLTISELKDLTLHCKPSELNIFEPPNGQTCEQFAAPFLNFYGGYVDNPNATSNCGLCAYSNGREYLKVLDLDPDDKAQRAGVFFCFIVLNSILLLAAQKFCKYRNR
ncbi:unnamed protein product [Sympodiomycopsis kandeliae]